MRTTRRTIRRTIRHSGLAATLLALALGGCRDGADTPGAGGGRPARDAIRFPVEVSPVESGRVEYTISAVGSVEAFETVAVTARVGGVIERIRFQEGAAVDRETVLAEIEPERYRLAAESARAALAKAEAAVEEARLGLARRESVNEKNPDLVRAEEVDSWRTRLAAARADADEKRTALALADLNLRDAFVRSPAAGVVQTRTAETGGFVQPGSVIATLVRREPLLLRFRVAETEAAPLAVGQEVRFRLRGAREGSYRATTTLVAAAADARDRMVSVTARIDDPARGELRPGAFAEVEVPVGSAKSAPVIPQTAIRPSDRGFLAFVIEGEEARERVLQLGLRTADGRVEVRSGLQPGERLVVRGAEALRDGAKVAVEGAAVQPETPRAPGASN
jgi:multidrug efflux system membrane fusion protein